MSVDRSELPLHFSSFATLNTTAAEAFRFLDNPMNLSSHMSKSSWMMAGSKMEMKLDPQKGRGVGAEIILDGKMLGIPLYIREFVVESEEPVRKSWQTSGPQKLIVIDQYKMGFILRPDGDQTHLEVFINYSLPSKGAGAFLGKLFATIYAKWCTDQMAQDAARHFRA